MASTETDAALALSISPHRFCVMPSGRLTPARISAPMSHRVAQGRRPQPPSILCGPPSRAARIISKNVTIRTFSSWTGFNQLEVENGR